MTRWYVKFPDGSFITKERDYYGIGSRHYTPTEIYACRGRNALEFSCEMNAQNLAWWVGQGAQVFKEVL